MNHFVYKLNSNCNTDKKSCRRTGCQWTKTEQWDFSTINVPKWCDINDLHCWMRNLVFDGISSKNKTSLVQNVFSQRKCKHGNCYTRHNNTYYFCAVVISFLFHVKYAKEFIVCPNYVNRYGAYENECGISVNIYAQ